MAWTARVAGQPHLALDPGRAPECRHQPPGWRQRGELAGLLDVDAGQRPALIGLGIGLALQIGARQPGAVGELEVGAVLVPLGGRAVEPDRGQDRVPQIGALLAHHQAARVLAVLDGVVPEIEQAADGLGATPGAAEQDDIGGAA